MDTPLYQNDSRWKSQKIGLQNDLTIDQGLKEGSLIMVRVDWTPDANIDSHWVVIHGKKDDDYKIWDPWKKDGAADTLKGRYGFGNKKPADIILEAIWHGQGKFPKSQDKPAATPGKTAKPLSKAKKAPAAPAGGRTMAVQPTVAQLTMRSQPNPQKPPRSLLRPPLLKSKSNRPQTVFRFATNPTLPTTPSSVISPATK